MRVAGLYLLGVSLFTCVPGTAQQVTNSAGAAGIEIVSCNWIKLVVRPNSSAPTPNSQTIERGGRPMDPVVPMPNVTPTRPTRHVYVYSATVVNKEQKPIKALFWNYTFSDPVTHAELKRQTGFSSARIGVNEKKTIDRLSLPA